MTKTDRKRLRRRQAIEPTIGHLKADQGMRRTWLKGSLGDALQVALCAAGFNLKWLMRAIALNLPTSQALGLIRLFIDTLKIDVLDRLGLKQSSQAKLVVA